MDDRSTCIIFADGAGAAVVGPAPSEDEVGVGPVIWGAAGDLVSTIHIDETDALRQEGQAVFRWATTKIAPVALRAVEAAGLQPVRHRRPGPAPGEPAHRRGDRQEAAPGRRPGRPAGRRRHPVLREHLVGLDPAWPSTTCAAPGRVRSGDVALLVGFGAGLSYGAQVVVLP